MGSTLAQIISHDVAYASPRCTELPLENGLRIFFRLLTISGPNQRRTLELLRATFKATRKEDVVNPLYNREDTILDWTCYTFDLDRNFLRYADSNQSLQFDLALFQTRPVVRSDGVAWDHPPPAPLAVVAFPPPYWAPTVPMFGLTRSLTRSIFYDLASKWEHILCSNCNDVVFRKLAYGIIRVASLDFRVRTVDYQQWKSTPNDCGTHVDLPLWNQPPASIFIIGGCTVVLDQDLSEALAMARRHISTLNTGSASATVEEPHYLLFSRRHVCFCRLSSSGILSYMKPIPLNCSTGSSRFDLSDRAIALLCHAFSSPQPTTRLHKLPLEVQSMVLASVSDTPLEPARLGALLGLGQEYLWQKWSASKGKMDYVLKACYSCRDRTKNEAWQIWFGDGFSGLTYQTVTRPSLLSMPAMLDEFYSR